MFYLKIKIRFPMIDARSTPAHASPLVHVN